MAKQQPRLQSCSCSLICAYLVGLQLVQMNPVVSLLAVWVQLGEKPGLMEFVGMVLLAAALILKTVRAMTPRASNEV